MKNKTSFRLISIIIFISIFCSLLAACGVDNVDQSTPNESSNDIPTSVEPTKRVAITFDDGPHNTWTIKTVDALAKYGFNATFFVVGNRVDGTEYNGGGALKYAADKGNEIAIHGYTHSEKNYYDICSDSTFKNELSETEKAIKNIVGDKNICLMRPVGGRITEDRVKTCKYAVIMWNVDSQDWKFKYSSNDTENDAAQKIDTIVNNVMRSVQDGSIILMHDIYESTYDALVIVLERLYNEGYEVVTVSELLGDELVAGRKYSQAK